MLRLTLILALAISALGFAPTCPISSQSRRIPLQIKMAEDKDNSMSGPSVLDEIEAQRASKTTDMKQQIDIENRAIKENPLASLPTIIFAIVPFTLLLNDAFHFLPKEWNLI
uniref:Uncharacterized protein n=1 Tax=Chaetoceros debilis TaxID=122233 RepID=A0A7S3V4Q5_9STRA|mmetsp:Transcript_22032/g.33487  ORF Transcript_22032/g.33487 Transcript_22032/m.33487 type:complete len:112 (+) Transcript_22032:109-444(+)